MKSIAEIQNGLAQMTGTEQYHKLSPLHGRMVCTDGVAWLAENAGEHGAHWLIDIIASYQPQCARDKMLRDFLHLPLRVACDAEVLPLRCTA